MFKNFINHLKNIKKEICHKNGGKNSFFFKIYWQRIKYRVFHYGDIGSGREKIREGKKIYFDNLKKCKISCFLKSFYFR